MSGMRLCMGSTVWRMFRTSNSNTNTNTNSNTDNSYSNFNSFLRI